MNPIEKIENAQKQITILSISSAAAVGGSVGIQMASEGFLWAFCDLLPIVWILWMGRIGSKALTDLREDVQPQSGGSEN